MPLIFAGFAWLVSALGAMLLALVNLVAAWVTKRTIFAGIFIAAYLVLVVALYAGIVTAMQLVVINAPSGFQQAAGMFLPSNANICLGAVITAYIARWMYDQHVKILDIFTQS